MKQLPRSREARAVRMNDAARHLRVAEVTAAALPAR